jgi:tRNA-guanine family transglycosylase
VLELQERVADLAFSLDFPIPPGTPPREAARRQDLSIRNAHWALANRRRRDLPLYACVQAADPASASACARAYVGAGFDGIALGGLVPRARDRALVFALVEAVRAEIGDLPLHCFGLGHPGLVADLYRAGVDSVDSSAYVKLAADGRLWSGPAAHPDPTPTERLHLALCNLAAASGRALPLSAHRVAFKTFGLAPGG